MPQLLSLPSRTLELQLLKPRYLEPMVHKRSYCNDKPAQRVAPAHHRQKKAHTQHWRSSTAKNKNKRDCKICLEKITHWPNKRSTGWMVLKYRDSGVILSRSFHHNSKLMGWVMKTYKRFLLCIIYLFKRNGSFAGLFSFAHIFLLK